MNNTILYDFVCTFFPLHKSFWDNLNEEERAFFNVIPYPEDVLKKVIFNPEENLWQFDLRHIKLEDLKFILSHRECTFDYFLFQNISNTRRPYYTSRFDFIFTEPWKYTAQVKELKTINGCMNKIYNIIPSFYREHEKDKHSRFESVFGKFYKYIDSVTYKSNFEIVEFKREHLNLIPYFLEYRNSHLIDFFVEIQAEEMKKLDWDKHIYDYNEFYEFYGLKSNVYKVETSLKEHVETRIRSILFRHKYSGAKIENNGNTFTIKYDAKNSLFATHCSYTLNMYNIDEELEKFELALQENY